MAAPNGRNFQVSGLGVRGHVWVEAEPLRKFSSTVDVLGTCVKIQERGFVTTLR